MVPSNKIKVSTPIDSEHMLHQKGFMISFPWESNLGILITNAHYCYKLDCKFFAELCNFFQFQIKFNDDDNNNNNNNNNNNDNNNNNNNNNDNNKAPSPDAGWRLFKI